MDEYRPTRVKYPELCDEIQESLDGSPFRLEDRIGLGYCNSAIRGIRVWPMFEQLYILERGTQQPISSEAKQRLRLLEKKIQEYSSGKSDLQHSLNKVAEDRKRYTVKVVNSDDGEYLLDGLEQVQTCYDRRRIRGITGRLLSDVALGGTIIYFLEKDGEPVTYNKLFVCPNNKGGIILFYDAIENGSHHNDSIAHWVEDGKFEQLIYSVAFSGYMAARLGLNVVALADRELDELGGLMGCHHTTSLSKTRDKLGWPTHPNNKGEVVHQNRLFNRGTRFHQIQLHKAREPQQISDKFRSVYHELERKDFNPKSHHFAHKLYYLLCANRIMQSLQIGNKGERIIMGNAVKQLQPLIDENWDVLLDDESAERIERSAAWVVV